MVIFQGHRLRVCGPVPCFEAVHCHVVDGRFSYLISYWEMHRRLRRKDGEKRREEQDAPLLIRR